MVMSDLQDRFTQAQADVKTLTERPDNEALLQLYSLYKQATQGDVSGKRPGMMDMVNRAKYDAWGKLRGMSPDDAKQAYVDLVNKLRG
jgi:diazepam-binding inhibitor (GABA receptor modulator, acyl-CoA-binding protein)